MYYREESRKSSRPDMAVRTYNEKVKALGSVRYINQLAQLDYEDKLTELHTKYTKASKDTMMKKIKAKNQIAEFIDEEDEYLHDFEDIIDYKHGKAHGFHFEKESNKAEFYFCPRCDIITDDHPEVH